MAKTAQKINIRRGVAIFKKYLAPYRTMLAVIGVFSLLDAAANAATPFFAGKIFDALVTPHTLASPLLGADIHADYLVAAFAHILELPLSFHKSMRVGEIVSRIQRASDRLESIANRILLDLLPDFLSIAITLGIVFAIQPRLSLVLVAAMGLYLALLLRTAPGLSAISYKMHHAYSHAFGYSSDLAMNAKNVKEATAEGFERRQLFRFFRLRAARLWTDYMKIWQGLTFFQRAIVTLMQLAIFVYSYYLVRAGALTPGGLVAFNGYAAIVLRPLAIIANNWDVVQNGLAAVDRAERIIERAPEAYVPANAVMQADPGRHRIPQ